MKTTQEVAKEKIHANLVDNLQGLLEKNYDAEKGFKKAVENTKNTQLKEFLKHQAVIHSRFATELDKEIRDLNEKPIDSGSRTAGLHRTWMDVKTAFTGKNDEAVLEECIRGEKANLKEYEEKLKDKSFPPQVNSMLTNHVSEIRSTVSKVKTLEDLADGWK